MWLDYTFLPNGESIFGTESAESRMEFAANSFHPFYAKPIL